MIHSRAYTTSGTFVVPTGVTCVLVTMIGGGGAGAWNSNPVLGMHGGGAGGFCYRRPCVVVPDAEVDVTLGAGGTSVDGAFGLTGNGGDTSFGSLTVGGGQGGFHSDGGHSYAGVGGNAAGLSYEADVFDPSLPPPGIPHGVLFPDPGFISLQNTYGWFGGSSGGTYGAAQEAGHPGGASANGFTGGVGGSLIDGPGGGGGGGGSPWGNGGNGATATTTGQHGHSPGAGHYGAGGGGPSGVLVSGNTLGGSGAPGYCLLEWYEKL